MIQKILTSAMACSFLVLTTAGAQADPVPVDDRLPSYPKVGGIAGNLDSIGSDTLNNFRTLWAEGCQKQYPNVRVPIEGKGSSSTGSAAPSIGFSTPRPSRPRPLAPEGSSGEV